MGLNQPGAPRIARMNQGLATFEAGFHGRPFVKTDAFYKVPDRLCGFVRNFGD